MLVVLFGDGFYVGGVEFDYGEFGGDEEVVE